MHLKSGSDCQRLYTYQAEDKVSNTPLYHLLGKSSKLILPIFRSPFSDEW